MPSTHAKAGFAEGQSVQGVMWAKDFIVWCFNRFRNGGDTVCSPSFCWSFGAKIGFAEVQPILAWEAKLCIKLLTSKHFSEKMQHFFCTAISYQPFCYFRGLKSGFWTAGFELIEFLQRGCGLRRISMLASDGVTTNLTN